MQTIVNARTLTTNTARTMAATIQQIHPARLRALVLAVLIACLAVTPITTEALQHNANTTGGSRAAVVAEHAGVHPNPTPVAGLDQTQMNHAATITATAKQMGLPPRAAVIGVATSLQETNLHNLANTGLPESLNQANDGTGYDHDSVGLFQQRPASGWGPVNQLMDPATSARKFYQHLDQVPGWQTMPVTVAAQTVQGSAFPDAYAQHQGQAEAVVNALTS